MKRFINLGTYAEFAYRRQQARAVGTEVPVLLTKPKLHREKVALEIDTISQQVDTVVRKFRPTNQ